MAQDEMKTGPEKMTDAEAYQDQLEYLELLDDKQLVQRAEEAKVKLEDETMILRVAKDLMAARGIGHNSATV